MQGHFGLKDLAVIVLLCAALVMLGLSLVQDDRRFQNVGKVGDRVENLESSLSALRRDVRELRESGVAVDGLDLSGLDLGGLVPSGNAAPAWARSAGVTVPERLGFVSPPYDDEGFREGGEFVEFFEAQLPKITPFLYSDVYGRRIVDGPVCESLAMFDPVTLRLKGVLAESWQYDPGGMWLRAKIHDDAEFSDGMPVTAEDFRWTFHEFVFNPELETARFRSVLNVIEEVVAVDEKVVEFRFREPKFSNLAQALRMYVVPKHFYETFTPSQLNEATGLLMGSGPYKLESVDPDRQWAPPDDVVLVRNPNYWRSPAPPIEQLRYKVIPDNVARLTAFENGEGHMMRATNEQYAQKLREPTFTDENYTEAWINMRSGFGFIAWNCGQRAGEPTPFTDARVRLAMTHLLDRDRIRRDFAEGLGAVATSPFPPGGPQISPEIEPWPYDLDRARALLDEAGWIDRDGDGRRENEQGEPFVFEYTISTSSTFSRKLAAYLRDQCNLVGVTCVERPVDWAKFADILDRRDFDALTMQWSASMPESDPFQLWHSSQILDRGDNFAQWSNPRADSLIEKGRATLDFDERMAVWHELHAVIHDDQPYTFVLNQPWIRFISRRVGNVQTYPIGLHKSEMFVAEPL